MQPITRQINGYNRTGATFELLACDQDRHELDGFKGQPDDSAIGKFIANFKHILPSARADIVARYERVAQLPDGLPKEYLYSFCPHLLARTNHFSLPRFFRPSLHQRDRTSSMDEIDFRFAVMQSHLSDDSYETHVETQSRVQTMFASLALLSEIADCAEIKKVSVVYDSLRAAFPDLRDVNIDGSFFTSRREAFITFGKGKVGFESACKKSRGRHSPAHELGLEHLFPGQELKSRQSQVPRAVVSYVHYKKLQEYSCSSWPVFNFGIYCYFYWVHVT